MSKMIEERPSGFQEWRFKPEHARSGGNTLPDRERNARVAGMTRGATCEGGIEQPDGRLVLLFDNCDFAVSVENPVVLSKHEALAIRQAYLDANIPALASLYSILRSGPKSNPKPESEPEPEAATEEENPFLTIEEREEKLQHRREVAQQARDAGIYLLDGEELEVLPFITGLTEAEQIGGIDADRAIRRDLVVKQAKSDVVNLSTDESMEASNGLPDV